MRGTVQTNGMKPFPALLKRDYHKASVQHLPRHPNEFTGRLNQRNLDKRDQMEALVGKHLTCREPGGQASSMKRPRWGGADRKRNARTGAQTGSVRLALPLGVGALTRDRNSSPRCSDRAARGSLLPSTTRDRPTELDV